VEFAPEFKVAVDSIPGNYTIVVYFLCFQSSLKAIYMPLFLNISYKFLDYILLDPFYALLKEFTCFICLIF